MTKAEKILNKCEHILDDYDADYRGGYVTNINGTDYIVFKYYGGKHDTIDRNDDSWDEIYDLEGVADVGYGSGYGKQMKGTNYYDNSDCLVIELEDGLNESKKSVRKSIKESLNFKKDYAVEVMGGTYWLKPFYWDFDEFRDDLLIASEESGFTYYITEATTTDYRINLEFNDGFYERYDITFRIIPKSDKATAKELNDYLN